VNTIESVTEPAKLSSPAPDLETIKARQRATWASGDYGTIGTTLQIVGESLCEAVDLRAGAKVLDVAAGNGNSSLAAARRWADVTSTDYVPGLLDQGRRRAEADRLPIAFQEADVEALPFADGSFDVVLSSFGVMFTPNHARAAGEMLRVCRRGGRVVLCDAVASDDAAKAAAFNAMERHRDPSTVEFRPLSLLLALFRDAGLPEPTARFYQVPAERDRLLAASFPANDDRALLRAMIDQSVAGDTMGVNARRDGDTVRFDYPAVVLVVVKGGQTLRV